MEQFFSSEQTSLDKEIEKCTPIQKTKLDDIDFVYDIPKCTDWIKSNNYLKVCLQFPDFLLPDSTEVCHRLQTNLNLVVYVMGDTAYESCCIDYVAAAHVNADAIIHFGPVCFSKSDTKIPFLNVYEKEVLDLELIGDLIKVKVVDNKEPITIMLDTPYIWYLDKFCELFKDCSDVSVIPIDKELSVRQFVVYVGFNYRKLINLQFSLKNVQLYNYNPKREPLQLINFDQDPKIIKRRRFLVEKIKDSTTIGIIIGTLAVKNYLKIINRIKGVIRASGKKYYVISVGKPNVAKLANFTEIDIYVLITCAMNEIYESRDFFKPIVTPYDVELALNPNANEFEFSFDYNKYFVDLTPVEIEAIEARTKENDVSLISGKIRSNENVVDYDAQLVLKQDGTVATSSSGAGFLAQRSWKGLEQNLGEDEPQVAKQGRRGIAQGYENEK